MACLDRATCKPFEYSEDVTVATLTSFSVVRVVSTLDDILTKLLELYECNSQKNAALRSERNLKNSGKEKQLLGFGARTERLSVRGRRRERKQITC